MTIGDKIKAIRQGRGWTQAQAAERYGCLQGRWADIEANRKSVTIDTLGRIADALECDIKDFF